MLPLYPNESIPLGDDSNVYFTANSLGIHGYFLFEGGEADQCFRHCSYLVLWLNSYGINDRIYKFGSLLLFHLRFIEFYLFLSYFGEFS